MLKPPLPPAGDPSTRKQKAKKATKKTVELREQFRTAHAKGMEALQRHDFDTLGKIIAEESQILDEQAALLSVRREEANALAREIAPLLKTGMKAKKAKKAKKKR